MFDNAEEDKDLESQVSKASSASSKDGETDNKSATKAEQESKAGVDKAQEETKPAATSQSTESQKIDSKEK
ncbi:hypothetical protein CH063_16142 [Colletotrichum higginsianum]|nr:hypothetical protein CH063_16142 [Colletotrichum higginsianum]